MYDKKNITFVIIIMLALIALFTNITYANIVNTKHNLSTSGPGPIKSDTENRVCVFCHTPHNSNPSTALWNHETSTQTYTVYSSESIDATDIGQPAGTSKLCLSCHDGTVALGSVLTGNISMTGTDPDGTMPTSSINNVGTNLSDDHPQDFTYGANLATNDNLILDPTNPSGVTTSGTIAEDMLENGDQMRCTSCHEPHDNTYGNFLIKDNTNNELCLTCHKKLEGTTSHKKCTWCHIQHDASEKDHIRKGSEENLCFSCHDGTTQKVDGQLINNGNPITDIKTQVNKTTAHPVIATTNTHYVGEGNPPTNSKHVECMDCHNVHDATGVSHSLGTNQVSGVLANQKGVKADYTNSTAWEKATLTATDVITYEYELCLRCHSSKVKDSWWPTTETNPDTFNPSAFMSKYINPKNEAHHAIVEEGNVQNTAMNATFTPNSGITINSTIYCSDCHTNDNPSGPQGPHGSNNGFNVGESQYVDSYGHNYICFDCHWEEVYGAEGSKGYLSRFPYHTKNHHNGGHSSTKFPSNIPKYSCFLCHGDFYRGGLHGTNVGNQAFTKESDTADSFLNGFSVNWMVTDASKGTVNCSGNISTDPVTGEQVGCSQHYSPDETGAKALGKTYNRDWNSDK